MISLSDLKAKRAAMTQGEYHAWGTVITAREPTPDCLNESALIGTADSSDATGIVATHNAADVLIEITEAALAVSEQDGLRDSKATYALRAALARVRP